MREVPNVISISLLWCGCTGIDLSIGKPANMLDIYAHLTDLLHRYADATFRVEDIRELYRYLCAVDSRAASSVHKSQSLCFQRLDRAGQLETERRKGDSSGINSVVNGLKDYLRGQKRFEGSAAHKKHLSYSLSDIAELDKELAEDIRKEAALYGYEEYRKY